MAGYEKNEILHSISLEVNAGEIVVLIGPNGAGKSTILKSIFGLVEIYGGKIFFQGKDIANKKTEKLIKAGIGFVPQGGQIFFSMSVLENLEMGAYAINDKEILKKNVADVLKEFNFLKERQKEIAQKLSGGQQQLLGIARALVLKPKLLILDEPSLGLSPLLRREIFKKIVEIKNKGVAILMVEQNVKESLAIANRVLVLENGKIIEERKI